MIRLRRVHRARAAVAAASAAGVAVAQVQPQRSVIAQHSAHFAEHADQFGDEFVRRRLQADLCGVAVVAQAEIGWAGNATMNRVVGQRFQQLAAVTVQQLNHSDPSSSISSLTLPARSEAMRLRHRAACTRSLTTSGKSPASSSGHWNTADGEMPMARAAFVGVPPNTRIAYDFFIRLS